MEPASWDESDTGTDSLIQKMLEELDFRIRHLKIGVRPGVIGIIGVDIMGRRFTQMVYKKTKKSTFFRILIRF